jgi:hypothetical protein
MKLDRNILDRNIEHNPFPIWVVRFKTSKGMYHPLWIGDCKGPNIEQSEVKKHADQYLKKNKHWLVRIDEIAPFKSIT